MIAVFTPLVTSNDRLGINTRATTIWLLPKKIDYAEDPIQVRLLSQTFDLIP